MRPRTALLTMTLVVVVAVAPAIVAPRANVASAGLLACRNGTWAAWQDPSGNTWTSRHQTCIEQLPGGLRALLRLRCYRNGTLNSNCNFTIESLWLWHGEEPLTGIGYRNDQGVSGFDLATPWWCADQYYHAEFWVVAQGVSVRFDARAGGYNHATAPHGWSTDPIGTRCV